MRIYIIVIMYFNLQEHSLTKEVIKKISPTESELLNDPTCNAKVRFR